MALPKLTEIRRCVVPAPGFVFVVADYSAIELRIVAALAPDDVLLGIFRDGGDPHRHTAAALFGKTESEVTAEERSQAKPVAFGFVYGMGPPRFICYAREFGLSFTLEQASEFRRRFLAAYPGIAAWHRRASLPHEPFAVTASGRRIRFANPNRSFTDSLNFPVQGTGADGLKVAMVLLHDRLRSHGARLVLPVHDELLVEAPEADAEAVKTLVADTMVEAMQRFVPTVPIVVEPEIRRTWAKE